MENEINELKITVNHLTVQLTALSVRNRLLESLVFGVILEKMPEDYKNIYSNFVDRYEESLNEVLDQRPNSLFDTGDQSFLIREKYKLFEAVQSMKRDENYLDDSAI